MPFNINIPENDNSPSFKEYQERVLNDTAVLGYLQQITILESRLQEYLKREFPEFSDYWYNDEKFKRFIKS